MGFECRSNPALKGRMHAKCMYFEGFFLQCQVQPPGILLMDGMDCMELS